MYKFRVSDATHAHRWVEFNGCTGMIWYSDGNGKRSSYDPLPIYNSADFKHRLDCWVLLGWNILQGWE